MELEALKRAVREAGADWTVEETSLAQYDIDPENATELLGYVPGPQEPSLDEQESMAAQNVQAYMALAAPPPYPSSYDWRNVNGENFVTSIKDQSTCGSCVAFGSCATVESTQRIEQHQADLDVDLSEAHLFYCIARSQGRRCSGQQGGWWPAAALDAFRDEGVADEACYPYVAGDQDCTNLCSDADRRLTHIGSYSELTSHEEMKDWISSRAPVVGTLKVYEDFVRLYHGGVYRHVAGAFAGGHCICVIGYDDDRDCWIGKNSWGTDWGEDGFFEIGYGECGFDSMMWGVEGVKPPNGGRARS